MSNFKAKMHQKIDFGCGSASDPAGGAHSAPPDPLAGFEGPTSKGGEGKGERMRGRGGRRREGGEAFLVMWPRRLSAFKSAPTTLPKFSGPLRSPYQLNYSEQIRQVERGGLFGGPLCAITQGEAGPREPNYLFP